MFGYSRVMIYTLFTSIWTGVIAIPSFSLAPTCCPSLGRSYITPALEVITMLLWLAQFIAMAVLIPSSDNNGFDGWLSATVLGAVEWLVSPGCDCTVAWFSMRALDIIIFCPLTRTIRLTYVLTTVRSIMDATRK